MRYPGAQWRPLPNRSSRPKMAAHRILCLHTAVGSLAGTESHFRNTQVDSHFGVGNTTDGSNDGVVYQWVDTGTQSHANLNGNHEVVSVETADGGDPSRPWSPKALDALVKLGIWVCKTHNIPPVLIPDTQPGRRGIAYHRMGCDHSSSYQPKGWPYDKWREPGGVKWSTALGKTCPGDARIRQLVDIVIPRIKAGVEGVDDMPEPKDLWDYEIPNKMQDNKLTSAAQMLQNAHYNSARAYSASTANAAAIGALAKALATHDGGELDADELVRRVEAAIAAAVIKVDVTVTGADDPKA